MARKKARITSSIDVNTKQKIEQAAAEKNVPMSEIIEQGVNKLLESDKTPAKVFVVNSNKGGTGKTTATACLGHTLGKLGYKVLLIDDDPQANLSSRFVDAEDIAPNARKISKLPTLIDALCAFSEAEDSTSPDITEFIATSIHPNVDIIPANTLLTAGADIIISNVTQFHVNILEQIIKAVQALQKYDYIFIDTRPALDNEISQVFFASDYVIIPTLATKDSIEGTVKTIQFCNKCRKGKPELRIAGAFFSNVNERTAATHTLIPQFQEAIPTEFMFKTQIPRREDAVKAENAGRPMTEVYPSGKASKAYEKLAKEIITLAK